jgi:hypothetical protein
VKSNLFETYPFDHLAATIEPDHVASVAVVRKAGFQYAQDVMSDSGGFDKPVRQKLFRRANPAVGKRQHHRFTADKYSMHLSFDIFAAGSGLTSKFKYTLFLFMISRYNEKSTIPVPKI